jgi:hypothetical protein
MSSFIFRVFFIPVMVRFALSCCSVLGEHGMVEVFDRVFFARPDEAEEDQRPWLFWDPGTFALDPACPKTILDECEVITSQDNDELGAVRISKKLSEGMPCSAVAGTILEQRKVDFNKPKQQIILSDFYKARR